MTCTDHQRTVNRFMDHEVKAAECGELFGHLGGCAECRGFYDTIITLGTELDKIHPAIEELTETLQGQSRNFAYRIANQKRIAPRPSTLAFVIVVMLVVSLLFSVNVTIEKPAQTPPTTRASQR